jgi:hypothetical protein
MPADPPVISPAPGKYSSGLELTNDLVDVFAKGVPLVAGLVYAVGYIVTARRLASYGVPATPLLSAQYFVAGLAPSLLIALTVAVVWSAVRYNRPPAGGEAFSRIGLLIVALYFVGLAAELGGPILDRRLGLSLFGPTSWADLYALTILRITLAEAALWYLIAGLRTRFFVELAKYFPAQGRASDAWMLPVFLLILAVPLITLAFGRAVRAYGAIPQAYGGAKPMTVRLFAEREKVPAELLPRGAVNPPTVLTYTAPLELLFQSSTVLIVRPIDDASRRVWTVDSRIVVSLVSNFEP